MAREVKHHRDIAGLTSQTRSGAATQNWCVMGTTNAKGRRNIIVVEWKNDT
jgi:hypothetical protein